MQPIFLAIMEMSLLNLVLAIFGASWAGIYWFSAEALSTLLSTRKFKRLYRKAPEKAMVHVDRLVSGQELKPVLISLGALLALPLALVLPLGFNTYAAPLAGFLGALGIISVFFRNRFMLNFRKNAVCKIANFLLLKGKNKHINRLLITTFQQPQPALQWVALGFMDKWGSQPVYQLLQSAQHIKDKKVRRRTDKMLIDIKRLTEAEPIYLEPLAEYFKEFDHCVEMLPANVPKGQYWVDYQERLKKVSFRIEKIILSQTFARTSFPHVYCKKCLSRGEQMVHAHWRYVRCKVCQEAYTLVPEVDQVVGVIGIEKEWEMKGETVFLSLWDDKQTAVPAEVDVLKLVHREGVNYDWAVSAVVESLKNRFPDKKVQVKVEIGPGIQLSHNTNMLLRELKRY